MTVTIRPLGAADSAEWREMWTAYLAFYGTTLPGIVFDTTFARLIDPAHEERHALVAERDGRLIGLVHYIYHAHNWRTEDVCYLQDLFVSAEARGSGAGRALIEAVYAAADANGTPSVYWMTQESNATARALYDSIATLTPFVKYLR